MKITAKSPDSADYRRGLGIFLPKRRPPEPVRAHLGFLARFTGVLFLTAVLCLPGIARAAVVNDGYAQDSGPFKLSSPYGVAADSLGNYYVADTAYHHIVKFNSDGVPKRLIGTEGFGNGQLYYPQGVAVGADLHGNTRVYVADTSNSRISVFDETGKFIRTFGDTTSDPLNKPGPLNNPGGVAYLKRLTGTGGLILVADTRNNRVNTYADNGSSLNSFQCPTCPVGGIRPLGVAGRWNANGRLLIYAVDELTSQVQVLNDAGGWVRSIGTKGTGPHQLESPDDVAVDEDGNVYVVDAGLNTQRVTKFGPGGAFLFSFNTAGAGEFTQPHGVGLDEQGKIYVADTGHSGGGRVYRFREEAPKLIVTPQQPRSYWISTKGAWFSLSYNGVEQTCRAGGTATIHAPAGSSNVFTIDGDPITIGFLEDFKMDMSANQANLVAKAWAEGKKISVEATFHARCQDGRLLQKTLTFAK